MKKYLKWVGIALIALFVIGMLIPASEKESTAATSNLTSTEPAAAPSATKQWTTVQTFKGSGMKKSQPFKLTGNDARIVYKYNSGTHMGGMLAVYVLEKGTDIQKEGGIPDIMISEPKEESESAIVKSAGDYFLEVNAQGKWEIAVEELQ